MGYEEEKRKVIDYVTQEGKIIQLKPNKQNLQENRRILKRFNDYRSLAIRFPGYKTTKYKCDYCVYLIDSEKEKAISHTEIMQDLYDKTTVRNYLQIKKYVEEVAEIGIDIDAKKYRYSDIDFSIGFSFEELTQLMFYIAIQEDINYPEARYQGRKMCFYRYLEAIYCKVHYNHSIEQAKERAKNNGYVPRLWTDVGNLYENISNIKR